MDIARGLLSRHDAAQYLGISLRTLDRRTKDGHIAYISSCRGGRVQYQMRELDKYIKKNTHIGGN